MISNKSSATLANDEYNARDGDSDLEPLIDISPVGTNPASPLSPQSIGMVTYRRGGDEDGSPSPKRSRGFEERLSSPSTSREDAGPITQSDPTILTSQETTSVKKGSEDGEAGEIQHVEVSQ